MSDSQQGIPTETALQLLAKEPRRQVIRLMAERPDGTTVDQLRTRLTDDDPTGDGADDLFVQLYHVHLPMLAAADVLKYRDSQGEVDRGPRFQAALSVLRALDDRQVLASDD